MTVLRPLSRTFQRSRFNLRRFAMMQVAALSNTSFSSSNYARYANVAHYVPLHRSYSSPAEVPSVKWPSYLAKRVHRRMRAFPRNYEVKELVIKAGMNPAEWAIAASSFRKSFLSEPVKYFENQSDLLAFGRVRSCKCLLAPQRGK